MATRTRERRQTREEVPFRIVRSDGQIKWKGDRLFVSNVLRGEAVAMLEVDNDQWHLYFGTVHLATWDGRKRRFEPPSPK